MEVLRVEIPADPAPNGYTPNPYGNDLKVALEYLRRESVSTDGWQSLGTKSDVRMEKKYMPGDPSSIPLVRGRGVLRGITPAQLYPIVSHTGARVHWDGRFEEGHPLQRYSRFAYKFYSIQKGAFLVSQRDLVGAQEQLIAQDGTIEVVQTSVPEDDKTRPVSGKVRATLTVAGWTLRPVGDHDTDVTYIVKVNPNGYLPTAIINRVVSEIPLCVVTVKEFHDKYGIISYIAQKDISSVVRIESYSHDHRELHFGLIGKSGDQFDLTVDHEQMYKNGYTLSLTGEGKDGVELTQETTRVHVKVNGAADGAHFDIVLRAA